MCRIRNNCWASFCPKYARSGPTRSQSLATTVSIPSKCPGRDKPSKSKPTWPELSVGVAPRPSGYISSTDGAKMASAEVVDNARASWVSERGYRSKSSPCPKLQGIDKNTDHDAICFARCCLHERQVSFVERAHGGNKANALAFLTPRLREFSQLRSTRDDDRRGHC